MKQKSKEKLIALFKSLTPQELSLLCLAYDDGTLDDIFIEELFPLDKENFPEDYIGGMNHDDI